LIKFETSGGSLFSKYEEGGVRLIDLMDLFEVEEIMNILKSTYGSDPINAMKLTKIVEELREMRRGENKSWFREYSISEIRQNDHSSLISSSMEAVLGRVRNKKGVYKYFNRKSIMKSF